MKNRLVEEDNDLYTPSLELSKDLLKQKKYSEAEPVIKGCMTNASQRFQLKSGNLVAAPAALYVRLLRETGPYDEARKAARQFGLP